MEDTKYYRFDVGEVLVRRTGDKIEKKGKKGIWEEAPELLWRFNSDDLSLIELSGEELEERLGGKE